MTMQQSAQNQGWHTAQWGTWGWVETILKLIAIAAGLVAFVRTISDQYWIVSNNPHLAALILLALLSLASILQVVIRVGQKEIISMIFAVLNLLGHFGLLIALLHDPTQRTLPLIFGIFYVLGQLVKLQFLRVTGYTEGGSNSTGMLRTAVVMAALYALFAILMLL